MTVLQRALQAFPAGSHSLLVESLFAAIKTPDGSAWDLEAIAALMETLGVKGSDDAQAVKWLTRFDEEVLVPFAADETVATSEQSKVIDFVAVAAISHPVYGSSLLAWIENHLAWHVSRSLHRGNFSVGTDDDEEDFDSGQEDDTFAHIDVTAFLAGVGVALPPRGTPRPHRSRRLNPAACFRIFKGAVMRLEELPEASSAAGVLAAGLKKALGLCLAFLFGSGNAAMRTQLRTDVVPAFLLAGSSTVFSGEGGSIGTDRREWGRRIWGMVEGLFREGGFPNAERLQKEVPALLCRCVDFFLGTKLVGIKLSFRGADFVALDLRQEELFWRIIHSGLLSTDASYSKYSVFLIKRVVDISNRFNRAIGGRRKWSRYFTWDDAAAKEWSSLWDDYCTFYDVFSESTSHLVEPIIPKLPSLLRPRGQHSVKLDGSWWLALVDRGISNRIASIRRMVFEYMLRSEDSLTLLCLTSDRDYLISSFLPKLDEAGLYTISGLGSYYSPFGELVVKFMPRLIVATGGEEEQITFVRDLFQHFIDYDSRIAVLYILMGIDAYSIEQEDMVGGKVFTAENLAVIRTLLTGDRSVTVWTPPDSKILVRWLCLRMIARLADRDTIYWPDIRLMIGAMAEYLKFQRNSVEYKVAREFCVKGLAADLDWPKAEWLRRAVKQGVTFFIELPTDASIDSQIYEAKSIAIISSFLLDETPTPDVTLLQEALGSLGSRLPRLGAGSIYASEGLADRCVILLHQLLLFFEECDPTIRIGERWEAFVRCRDHLYDFLKGALLSSSSLSSFQLVSEYAGLLENLLMLPTQSSLSGRLSSLWTTAWEILNDKNGSRATDEDGQDSTKYAAVCVLRIVLDHARRISFYGLQPCEEAGMEWVLGVLAIKRSLNSDEERKKNWVDLQHRFQSAKYSCVLSFNRYLSVAKAVPGNAAASRAAFLKASFNTCLDAIGSASYATAPSLFRLAAALLDEEWDLEAHQIDTLMQYGKNLVEENWINAKHFTLLIGEFAKTVFHEHVLSTAFPEKGHVVVEEAFDTFFKWGELKMSIVPFVSTACFRFWSKSISTRPEDQSSKSIALSSLRRYSSVFIRFLTYGPLWDLNKDMRRMDASISLKVKEMQRRDGADTEDLAFEEVSGHIPMDAQKQYYPLAFEKLMPWITTNHFSIRLYAQYAVFMCWKACNSDNSPQELKQIASTSAIAVAAKFIEQNPECRKQRQKADNTYYLTENFDPVGDATITFIFQGAMMVLDVTEEERISWQAFDRINNTAGRQLKLQHDPERRALWTTGSASAYVSFDAEPVAKEKEATEAVAPLQRKIVPWEAMMTTEIDVSETRDEQLRVREPDLVDYLLKKKAEGYSILGIEQATNSVSLDKFRFPRQSLLVLGKEKEGIPAHILSILDYVLEIPQFGLIRSLNVHVSGSLILWEYTRQLIGGV
ncbi:Tar (HIV-1) RNA binding protein 1 [Phlyctochytrium bullatum]|nr:Tar (HIV-1) RNA binding protein 1 [Phlyctochytrium bullatum]